jgi:16S rRNA (adenine1518-N6/adenine1519-N6)-dimethyltransferase
MGEAPHSQTLSFLLQRFAEAGIRPKTQHGQNFLIDLNLQRLLVRTADLQPHDVVLEVGTGTGSLTAMIAPAVAAVVTVEMDPQLFQLASEELYQLSNVVMIRADALASKNRLNPDVLRAVEQKLSEAPDRVFKLVANLPFNVATPIITNMLALPRPPKTMTVTIQKEVADRLIAKPSTKDYGALSVWVQCQCSVQVVRVMPPQVFWPRPKVHSAIVHLVLDEARRAAIPDLENFHAFVRAIFAHRRKFLRAELTAVLGKQTTKEKIDEVLRSVALTGQERAEQLSVDRLLALCEAARAAGFSASQAAGHEEPEASLPDTEL